MKMKQPQKTWTNESFLGHIFLIAPAGVHILPAAWGCGKKQKKTKKKF